MKVKLTTEQFDALRALLSRAAGLVFDESRRQSMAYSVAERVRESGASDVTAYLAMLDDPAEQQRLLDEVTIQETHFFRNPPQVRALRTHVLPELIAHAAKNGRRLRIWSAGCSTGEEPYTVAMILRELMPSTIGWDVKVIATDISSRALAAARTGQYGARAVQMASPEELTRFFQRNASGHEVRPEVRELVEFRHHNLVTEPVPFAPDEHVDLILCRNVTIYFGRQTTRALMERLHRCLRDGGYLFLGHSETLWQVSEQFHLVSLGTGDGAAFVYRRQDGKGERRAVLPDRRTQDEGPPQPKPERRHASRRHEQARPAPARPPLRSPSASPVEAGDVVEVAPPRALAVRATVDSGDYEGAIELAGAMIEAEPLNGEGFYLRGLALTDLGRDDEALVDLRKAVYLEPSMGFAHFLLAGVLDRLGHPAAAAVEYGATADTLGKHPGDATAHELGGRSVRELVALCRQLEGVLASRAGLHEEAR
ncbi:MAG: methyltransferase, CheR-type [Frankiales bacterium]|nr:methyltransferase, CheR-type [Frankiales bacterium]